MPAPTEEQHQTAFRRLVGRRINQVRYVEIDYQTGKPAWRVDGESFHSLDLGVELELEDQFAAVTWGWEFDNYGVTILDTPLSGGSSRTWPADNEWAAWLGRPILEARLVWSFWTENGQQKRYPQTVALRFDGAPTVWLSAFEYRPDTNFVMCSMDHITVFFRDEDLRKFRLDP